MWACGKGEIDSLGGARPFDRLRVSGWGLGVVLVEGESLTSTLSQDGRGGQLRCGGREWIPVPAFAGTGSSREQGFAELGVGCGVWHLRRRLMTGGMVGMVPGARFFVPLRCVQNDIWVEGHLHPLDPSSFDKLRMISG